MAAPHPRRRHISRGPPSSSNSQDALPARVTANMTLQKGATFHSPSTPPTESVDPVLCIPSLPRRSQTSLGEASSGAANIERMTAIMSAFDQCMSNPQSSTIPNTQVLDTEDLPLPRGMLIATVTAGIPDGSVSRARLDRSQRQTRATRKHHASDSGIGSTESGTIHGGSDICANANPASSTLNSVVSNSIQQTPLAISQTLSHTSASKQEVISPHAARQVGKHILQPLLQNSVLEDFHPIVRDIPSRIQRREISCLRDVEKALVLLAPARSKSAASYLLFCETSIQCIHTTVSYISERDQRRPSDPPYTNGYFVDLVEQVREYSRMMAAARQRQAAGDAADEMDYSPTESLVLEGGLSQTGRPAQLVRKKDGKTIPIGTGSKQAKAGVFEGSGPPASKRASPEVYEEDSVQRSMARRRRLAPGEVAVEPAPRVCSECHKEFKRSCDLTKHEKTHSRPWKCIDETCKYHTYGWPTEKERDRHVNDKHSDNPAMFSCQFCAYKSKRDSNRKQHMEKAHGWKYVRAKTTTKSSKVPSAGARQVNTPVSNPGDAPTPASIDSVSSVSHSGALPHGSLATSPNMQDLFAATPNHPALAESPFSFNDFPPAAHGYAVQPISSAFSPGVMAASTTPLDFTAQSWMDDANTYNAQLMTPDRSIERRALGSFSYPPEGYAGGMTPLSPAQQRQNLSPGGQSNVMLYSPESFSNAAVDEGYEEFVPSSGEQFSDWPLFPPAEAGLTVGNDTLFQDPQFFGSQGINFDTDMGENGM